MTESTDKPVEEASAIPALVETPAAQSPSEVNLSIQDLSTAMQIINVVTSRGAIKAEEMSVVGGLYNKLKAFLTASDAALKQAEADAEAAKGSKLPDATNITDGPTETSAEETVIGSDEK